MEEEEDYPEDDDYYQVGDPMLVSDSFLLAGIGFSFASAREAVRGREWLVAPGRRRQ